MLPDSRISPRDLCLQDGSLVGTGGTASFSDELILGSGIVDVCEGFFVWAESVGGFGGAAGEEVTTD